MSLDRLTALFRHVKFRVLDYPDSAFPRLRVSSEDEGYKVSFCQSSQAADLDNGCLISLDFGSKEHPLLSALPPELHITFNSGDQGFPVAAMIVSETNHARCGGSAVLDRLFEILLILLLRRAIEQGEAITGLLAGLSDNNLKFALSAVHDNPGEDWTTDKLAELSHLSRTAFYQRFNKRMGVSPMQYVRSWRMSIARIQLSQGDRIAQVAIKMGYRSTEGFSRAFHQHFNLWPGVINKTNVNVIS